MYLEHFKINKFPFSLTPNTEFFCHLPCYQDALDVLLFGVKMGEGFIKVIGEVGSGKTILCRKFLDALDARYMPIYISSPDVTPGELRKAFARELGVALPESVEQFQLIKLIADRLLELHREGKRVLLVIDEAQALSDESLEALRLLTNLETDTDELLQIVLFGQPELNVRLNQHRFRQLNQRITFSYHLKPLTREDLYSYVYHRLAVAGYAQGKLLTNKAIRLLFHASGGIPRVINILCHKAMLASYGFGDYMVGHKSMSQAVMDSQEITDGLLVSAKKKNSMVYILTGLAVFTVAGYYYWAYLFRF